MSTTNPFVASDDEHWFAPAAGWWRRLLAVVDHGALRLLDGDARAGIRAMDRLGRLAHAAGIVAPSRDDAATFFDTRPDTEVRQIARASAALRFKNRASIAVFQARGIEGLVPLVATAPHELPASVTVRPHGAILLAFHVGAQFGIGATLHRAGVRSLTLRDLPVGDAHGRARALRQAVDELRAGALIVAVVDGPGGASTAPVTCLGRRIVLRRGPFMLARTMRVPLIPAVARWTPGGEIVTVFGEPLDADRDGAATEVEARFAAATAAWIERYVGAHPGEIWPYTLANFLAAPRA